jgi:hypothetical protein
MICSKSMSSLDDLAISNILAKSDEVTFTSDPAFILIYFADTFIPGQQLHFGHPVPEISISSDAFFYKLCVGLSTCSVDKMLSWTFSARISFDTSLNI